MDQNRKDAGPGEPGVNPGSTPEAMDEFFNQLQSDMRRSDISQEAVAAAFEAIQQMGMEGHPEPAQEVAAGVCGGCGAAISAGNRFCSSCGMPAAAASAGPAAKPASGQHHYHHHYHHHYFSNSAGQTTPVNEARQSSNPAVVRDSARLRIAGGASGMSRLEVAVRKTTHDWALACNTKHLDDLVGLYANDATLLRPNVPPVRGAAAIREFFFAVLDAGLGDVELEPLRVELLGDMAFETGRGKMLVPVAMGKRREERGKYLMVLHRQDGEWKIMADCWSSDLSLAAPAADATAVRLPRKGA